MPDHELLEVLLYTPLRRINTNNLAHALLNRFGSLDAVLDAGEEALMSVEGVGRETAFFLSEIAYLWHRYERSAKQGDFLGSMTAIGNYLVSLYRGVKVETVYLLLLDNAAKLIECHKLTEGSVNLNTINPRQITEIALARRATRVVMAHNHPAGTAEPSDADVATTLYLRRILSMIDLVLEEHFIVAGDSYYPLLHAIDSQKEKKAQSDERKGILYER